MTPLLAALRTTTERLAAELAQPRARAPRWSAEEWVAAQAAAALHGVGPLLARRLRWQGPSRWQDFLDGQYEATRLRHERLHVLLGTLHERARAQGLTAMALKGVALHALGIYRAGQRPMADVDLLVRPSDAARAGQLIEELGYRLLHVNWKERAYAPRDAGAPRSLGEGADNPIKIELHVRICEKLPLAVSDITATLGFTALEDGAGLVGYRSAGALLTHLLLHAAGSMTCQALRLLQLNDIAALSRRLREEEWRELLACRPVAWWAYPPLALAARYFVGCVPTWVLRHSAGQCRPRLLRSMHDMRLTDVSYSHPWVDALPAGAWCGPIERARYAWQRLRPTREQQVQRAGLVQEHEWARSVDWHGMSQARRLLRFVRSRQVRPATAYAVTAARSPDGE